jgi:hypothetical protein
MLFSNQLTKEEVREAKDIFFGSMNIGDYDTQKREVVITRMAFANAFVPVSSSTTVSKALERNHSTIVYYNKQHEGLLKYKDYKQMYEYAIELSKFFMGEENEHKRYIDLVEEVERLKAQVSKLLAYKKKVEAIVEIVS